jgi:hypothetical protein
MAIGDTHPECDEPVDVVECGELNAQGASMPRLAGSSILDAVCRSGVRKMKVGERYTRHEKSHLV